MFRWSIRSRAVLVTVALLTGLSGCGGGDSSSGPTAVSAGSAPAPGAAPAPATGAAPAPAGSTVRVSGVARYESVPSSTVNGELLYASTSAKPIRGAVVEILNSPGGAVLATTESNDVGQYEAAIPSNTSAVVVRVRAQLRRQTAPTWDFRVADNTDSNALYVLDSSPQTVGGANRTVDLLAGSGWTGSGYGGARSAGPFAVLDTIYQARSRIQAIAPDRSWPALTLMWSVNNRPSGTRSLATGLIPTTFYSPPAGSDPLHRIYVLGQANVDTDEYDSHVIAHEFGHYLQQIASRDDSTGGPHGGEALDMRLAFSEGWGDGWSAIALSDSVYRDSSGNLQRSGFARDVSRPVTSGPGWYKSLSISYVLWTINERLGFAPLWQAMTGPVARTSAATSAHSLGHALKQVAPSQASTFDSIFASQAITVADAFGSTEANDGAVSTVLPIYKPLAALGSPTQLCVSSSQGQDANNKLGNFAYARLTLPASRSYSFTLTGGAASDPDFELFNERSRIAAQSETAGVERLTRSLVAGEYFIAVTDFRLPLGRSCLTLTVN